MEDRERRQALADFLRSRRERLTPAEVGLPPGMRRRTPGLRREEVALLANIGTSWYVSLEQGRDVQPSEQVLESLAKALRLNAAERRHLFVLAQPPSSASHGAPLPEEETVGEGLERAVQALDPHPAYVLGRRWDLLTWNRAAELVFGFSEIAPPFSRNMIWRNFTSPVLRSHRHWEKLARGSVAQFRADSARYPGDPGFAELIEALQARSEAFRSWWSKHDVRGLPDGTKRMDHPALGKLEFDYVSLRSPDREDQKFILYTCAPGTADRLIRALAAEKETVRT
ncbi:helix-turn-helix transcriptional regulator [Cohnella nanjingensis]|uniref:Helix-turn-helix domain-containing protein n=1 Tax=Cohnella nanjingensis TaxID=1387779 RepID=A0A7X0RUU9_9BACL|nr:helix-turn-helix transcriptional regulator [Cohnella nanjingensis]MBB6674015.1 helix-turn-helix domain-containing protein [Cohnella nanjingensis]